MPSADVAVSVDGDDAKVIAVEASGPWPETPYVGRLGDNPGFLAARYSFFAASIANQTLAEFGLRTRAYSLLELATVGDGMSQGQIGRILCLDGDREPPAGHRTVERFRDEEFRRDV